MSLGLDRLKSALMALGLKCGGYVQLVHVCVYYICMYSTLEERAKRLYSTKGLTPDKIDPSLFAKAKKSTGSEFTERQKEIAFLEAQVYRYAEILAVSYILYYCSGITITVVVLLYCDITLL